MITHDDDHARFRSQLADHLLDLLDEQENAVLESHARHCPDCGRLLAAARRERADWWEGTGHPPVGLLAAEPLDERVRLHVSGCADCRDEVALLSGAVVDPAPAPPFLPLQAPTVRRSAHGRIWVTAGSVAAVLAMILVARQQSAQRDVPSPAPLAGSTQPDAVVPQAPPAPPLGAGESVAAPPLAARMEPIAIADATRGESSPATAVSIPAGVTEVPLTLPALFLPEGVGVVVELRRVNGDVLARQELPAARAQARGGVRFEAGRFSDGPLVLRVAWLDGVSGAEAREYSLNVTTHH
ncbi:MAG: hypothetical protein IT348_07230 [Candidatus Eisenbacteria bacterium]|nr:hypothetical protein [Candidatus Eisenbacteria bacterium]